MLWLIGIALTVCEILRVEISAKKKKKKKNYKKTKKKQTAGITKTIPKFCTFKGCHVANDSSAQ